MRPHPPWDGMHKAASGAGKGLAVSEGSERGEGAVLLSLGDIHSVAAAVLCSVAAAAGHSFRVSPTLV